MSSRDLQEIRDLVARVMVKIEATRDRLIRLEARVSRLEHYTQLERSPR